METPEFTFEQDASNVQQAIHSDGLTYPVVQDNRYGTWNAYQNQYWPAEYLIDAKGQVRHAQFGEGDYEQDEAAVRQLLYEAGARHLPPPMTAHGDHALQGAGHARDLPRRPALAGVRRDSSEPGVHFYAGITDPALNQFALNGTWKVNCQSATPVSDGASITGRFQAAHVYLVMTSAGNIPRTVKVLLDGKPISTSRAAPTSTTGSVTVRGQRLYSLVSLPDDQQHLLTVQLPPGVSAYDFTFG